MTKTMAMKILVEDSDSLFLELEESEHIRKYVVAAIIDQKKAIEILRKEKTDLLAETTDHRELIAKPLTESKPESFERGNEIVSEEYSRIEDEVKALRLKGSGQQWFMDSGCSKHMSRNTTNFLSLKTLQRGSVSFGNGKKWHILGVVKVGKSLTHTIENVYYVNGLKYSLLSVSQICDKGNKLEFLSKICTVTDLVTGEIVLVAKRYKNVYVADFESL
uniref:Retrovirus-related Pol polyprotein from transposon TNT 1-94-like beta-barrel domain-containing protein n=1 Tax=Nicotiana tabacum TaxID=4097 RepID=A0A1S3YYG0_TOBAC|nr:PREDICTED: uncharacterized protein LOC107781106 [Nicotiana tabacum]